LYDRLGSAILALFLAMLVWVVATYEADPPKTDVLQNIPVQIRNKGPNLRIMNNVDAYVQVEVRAPESSWKRLDPTSFEAYVDLSGVGEGTSTVDVHVSCPADPAVQILQQTPVQVTVRLEELTAKKLSIIARVLDADSLPLGYVSRPPTVKPTSITVSGPRSIVERAQQATVDIRLQGARQTVDFTLKPTIRDAKDNTVLGLEISPTVVQVQVQIERQLGYRDATVSAVIKGSPAPGYWVSNIAVDPPVVTVYGKPQIIEEMPGFLETTPIDIEGVSATVAKRVPLALPEGVSVYSENLSGQTVNVRIEITPQLGGQTLRRPVEYQGLRTGYRAVLSPEVADVILSGPLPELQALTAEDVRVVLDLLGLREGTHKLKPTVLLPEGSNLQVKTVQPEVIEVTIELVPTEQPVRTPTPEPTPTPTIAVTPTPAQTVIPTATPKPLRGP